MPRRLARTHITTEPTRHPLAHGPADDRLWLASLIDASGAALVGFDRQGCILFWSQGAAALFGWTSVEVIGQSAPIVPPPLRQEWQLQMQRVLDTGEPTPAAETQRLARDGRVIPVVRSSSPLRDIDGQIIGLLDTLTDITSLKQLDEESRAVGKVRERDLIAMDLHDGLIQSLYAVVLNLATRERTVDASAREALKASRADVEHIIEETRNYLSDLRTREFVPSHLASGLQVLADGLRLNAHLDVKLNVEPGVEQLLEPEARGHLLFVAREAISNVLRHANASSLRIELTRRAHSITLSVIDDGCGFSTAASPGSAHRGLRNMAERARLVGGRLSVEASHDRGARLCIEVPLFS